MEKRFFRLSPSDYEGLHSRYRRIMNDFLQPIVQMAAPTEEQFQELSTRFSSMMRALYRQKGAVMDISIMQDKEVTQFISEHTSVLDSSFSHVPMSDTMRQRLHRSDYVFSGIKAFHELNQAFPSLLDENGERKPFTQFLQEVLQVDKDYNVNYLRAEFNFAQASAQMASRWESFDQDTSRYMLQYRTQRDSHVRPEHASMDGITLPMDDPFWEEYYPPNGWNCRCTVVQVRSSRYPATPEEEAQNRAKEALKGDRTGMFRYNPGLQKKTFPDYNPYTIRRCNDCQIAKDGSPGFVQNAFVPECDLCQACQTVRKQAAMAEKETMKDVRIEIVRNAERITRKSSTLKTGTFFSSKISARRAVYHLRTAEEAEAFSKVSTHLESLEFSRTSKLGESKDPSSPKDQKNVQKKKDRGVTGYNTYTLNLNGEIWEVLMEVHRNKMESIYNIKKANRPQP